MGIICRRCSLPRTHLDEDSIDATMSVPFRTHTHYHYLYGKPCAVAGFCGSSKVCTYLTAGDTVRIKEGRDGTPSFIGRIAQAMHGTPNWEDAIHRDANKKLACFFIQHYITPGDELYETVPQPNDSLLKSAFGMLEAVETDRFVWVSSDQVEEIVYLLHEDDIMEHTFGSVAGRSNCFFVRYFGKYDHRLKINYTIIKREEYQTFGATTGTACGTELFTERMLFALKQEGDNSRILLNKKAKSLSPNKSYTAPKSKESWYNFIKTIEPCIETISKKTKSKRDLPHTDFSMESIVIDARLETVTAETGQDFRDVREILSSMFGVGVRKRFPTKANIKDSQRNPSRLASHDTLHVVDIPLEEDTILDRDINESRFPVGLKNAIIFQWNTLTRLCTTTIRCAPIVASANNSEIVSFLARYKLDWLNINKEYEGLFVGAVCWSDYEERQYKIKKIDDNNRMVTIVSVDSDDEEDSITMKEITFEECHNDYPKI